MSIFLRTAGFLGNALGKFNRLARAAAGIAWKILPALAVLILAAPWTMSEQSPSPQGSEKGSVTAPATEAARPPQELVEDGKVIGKQVEPRPGEYCLVCDEPLGEHDVVYLVRGQRVALHVVVCYSELAKDPQKFLAILQPHGAFLGAGAEEQGLSPGWFLVGLYILLGLIFAALCAQHALHAGHNPVAWFGVGLVLNAFGYLLLLTRPKREVHALGGVPKGLGKVAATYAPQPCPGCGKMNHPAAEECAGCGGKLHPAVDSEVKKAGLRSS